jgi:hypothetical protein
MKLGTQLIITTSVIDVRTTQILSSSRLQMTGIEEIFNKLPGLVSEIVQKLPKPNYFVGTWISQTTYQGKTLECILQFNENGTINVLKYDTATLEQIQQPVPKKGTRPPTIYNWGRTMSGTGSGRYAYDGEKINITLSFRGTMSQLPSITTNQSYSIDSSKNGFEINDGGLSCSYRTYIRDNGRITQDFFDSYSAFIRR